MALAVILHRVRDYQAWRAVYDAGADFQKAGGVTAEAVYRTAGDPDNVLVLLHFASVAAAEAFLANPGLKAKMERAGVEGQPRMEIYEEA